MQLRMENPEYGFDKEIDQMNLDWLIFKKEFINTGRNIHRFMIEYLKANTLGKSNASGVHLHSEIDFQHMDLGDYVEISIGDISTLNTNAPWWKLTNYGGRHPMAGRFLPGGFSGSNKWIYDPGSNTGRKISENATIKPINYIENAEHYGTAEYATLIALLN